MSDQTTYSVSELNNAVRNLLEGNFEHIIVAGEISNFVCPASGHWYFSLKDSKARNRSDTVIQKLKTATHYYHQQDHAEWI